MWLITPLHVAYLCAPCIFQSLKSHVHRHHSKTKAVPTEGKSQSQNVILSCQVEDCKFQSTVFLSPFAHLKCHIRNGNKLTCPYTSCARYLWVSSTLFLSRTHKFSHQETSSHTASKSQPVKQCTMAEEMFPQAVLSELDAEQEDVPDQSQFLNSLAFFYLKMQVQMLLPATTIQAIIEEFQEVHNCGSMYFRRFIRS